MQYEENNNHSENPYQPPKPVDEKAAETSWRLEEPTSGGPDKLYEYWRYRILFSTMIGYIFFYFIRKNLSMAMPLIEEELGITKATLGIFLTMHGLLYGLSRFTNGILADRANPRYFMAGGLLLCAIMNYAFGMSAQIAGNATWQWLATGCFGVNPIVFAMGVFWVLNGWFQGMGFPPCAKSLSHWFAPEERGVKFSIWNTSHSIGAGFVFLLNAVIIWWTRDWRYCFFIPSGLAILGAFFLWDRLRDTPESMGLEPVEDYYHRKHGLETHLDKSLSETAESSPQESWGRILLENVFTNPAIWIIGFANFFVYVVRFTMLDWVPAFLKDHKGIEVVQAGIVSSAYEFVGVLGMLAGGVLMDKVFRGRGGKVCFLYMFGCTITIALYWWVNPQTMFLNAVFLAILGFFIYGPQCLIGVIAANVATKKAAAAANGLTGILGYLSGIISGVGVGYVAENHGWDAVLIALIGFSFLGTVLFLFVFNAAAPEQLAAEKAAAEKQGDYQ